ncbi:VanW family protein [Patescibacteria group bacterium]
MKKIITYFLIILFIALIGSIFSIQLINSNKICQGIKIANINIGGKTSEQAQEIIEKEFNNLLEKDLVFNYQNSNIVSSVKLTDLGFQINYQKTIDQASNIKKTKEQILSLFNKYNFDIIYDFDQNQFKDQIANTFKDIEKSPQNAILIFDEQADEFILQKSTEGIIIDKEKLFTDLSEIIRSLSNNPIDLKIILKSPSIIDNETDLAKQKAQKIADAHPFKVKFEDKIWTIKKSELVSWINFEPTIQGNSDNYILGAFLDRDKIKSYLTKIAWATNQPVLNAELKIEDNRAIVFSIPQQGYGVQIDKTTDLLMQNILAEIPIKEIEMSVGITHPENTLSETNDLGINILIGQGTSDFSGSPNNRIHNIKTGAKKFNGLILAPNEEFSFNNLLEGSEAEQGFLPELVIKNGELISEYGGGLCQVSTTLFRAAVNTGLKITERKPHAFPISYYAPHGFDATVYDPKPDFRFINDTPAHILIQSIIEGNKLSFKFYGTDSGRKTKIIGPTILEQNQNGSMKTILTQEIYQDGILVRSENFISDYVPPFK